VRGGSGCGELLRARAGWKWCSGRISHATTRSYSMSIYICRLAFEWLWMFFRILGSESPIRSAGLRGSRRVNRGGTGRDKSASQRPHPFPTAGKGRATPGCTNRSPRDTLCYSEVKIASGIIRACGKRMARGAETGVPPAVVSIANRGVLALPSTTHVGLCCRLIKEV
jgi:hypothetical protein